MLAMLDNGNFKFMTWVVSAWFWMVNFVMLGSPLPSPTPPPPPTPVPTPAPLLEVGDEDLVMESSFVFNPNVVWSMIDDDTTLTLGMNEIRIAQANQKTGEVRVLVTPTPTPVPREKVEHEVWRKEKTTLERIDAEIADTEREVAHHEGKAAEARALLTRLKAERATVDAALPTPTATPAPSPTPKEGR